MAIDITKIKELRNQTGVSIADCREALEKADGDMKRALEFLKERGAQIAEKKATRAVGAGIIDSYIHHTGTSGATVVLLSETDFVARNPEFQNLAHEIAKQVTASNPSNVSELLNQPWIKDESKIMGDLVKEYIAKFGENIKVQGFKRFEVGEEE